MQNIFLYDRNTWDEDRRGRQSWILSNLSCTKSCQIVASFGARDIGCS